MFNFRHSGGYLAWQRRNGCQEGISTATSRFRGRGLRLHYTANVHHGSLLALSLTPMLSRLISSTLVLALTLLLIIDVSSVSASRNHLNVPRNRHQQLTNRLARAETVASPVVKPLRKRKSCRAPTGAPKPPSLAVNSTSTQAPSTKATATPTKTPVKENPGGGGGGGKGGVGKPANWPSQTQAGAAPTAIRAHPGDPLLKELSKAYDNSNNALFNAKHSGQMTY